MALIDNQIITDKTLFHAVRVYLTDIIDERKPEFSVETKKLLQEIEKTNRLPESMMEEIRGSMQIAIGEYL